MKYVVRRQRVNFGSNWTKMTDGLRERVRAFLGASP